MTRPDSFLPSVDIINSPEEYVIILDIPGMVKEDITIYRRNVVTVVKGVRKRVFLSDKIEDNCFSSSDRKFGEFTLNFKIPNEYERKWSYFEVEEGVMFLKYKRDNDDSDITMDKDIDVDLNVELDNEGEDELDIENK